MSSLLPSPEEFKYDLWQYLADVKKPVVMYGMGNGADKILAVLEKYGVSVADFFASDGFVRGHSFHGKTVLSFDEIKAKYRDFIILLSFGSCLPELLERFYLLSDNYEFYAPDVPVSGSELFTLSFYKENHAKFEKAYSLFNDEESKRIFANVIRYKITGNVGYLKGAESSCDCEKYILSHDSYKTFIDVGAYNGDTAKKFVRDCKNASVIHAIEPDPKTFKKLSAYAEGESLAKVVAYNFAASDKTSVIDFSVCGNRNSALGTQNLRKTESICTNTVDSLGIFNADYIKYDVEGAEHDAVVGSAVTVESSRPDMLISMYHRSRDMFDLPLLINEMYPYYKLYLRRFSYVPAWDLNLYAVK